MIATPITGTLALLMSRLARYQAKAEEVNRAAASLGLPPAFDINFDGDIRVKANPDYRFEGFGVVIGLPPKLSFHVHYKPESEDHVRVGRFLVPIGFGDIARIG